jgi:predicted dehydrogenase
MSKIRIGFVGAGTMGQMAHLRNYLKVENCEVVALAELREKTGQLVAHRYGIPNLYRTHEEMLDAHELDGVVAAQPFRRHAVLLPEIYPRVPNVFTEKPLAVTPNAGQELARLADEAGCVHMVGYHKRSDPATIYAKDLIDRWKGSGEVGAMRYVRITMPPGAWIQGGFDGLLNAGDEAPSLPCEPPPEDMSDEVRKEYVSFVNYYIHQVNLLRHLLGEPYRVTYAEPSGRLLAVESERGVAGTIEMAPYETFRTWEESALVGFARGYVRLELPAPMALNRAGAVEVLRDPGGGAVPERTRPAMPNEHAMYRQAVNFVRVCSGEAEPPCDAAEAVGDLRIARDYIRMRMED